MTKASRCSVLDEIKKKEILAIVAVGCGRRTAATYVGCKLSVITREMEKDEAFAAEMHRHESNPEIGFARNIQDAAKKAQYWRAAAWWLERRNPDDFGPKKQGVVTVAQLQGLLSGLTIIITEEVPPGRFRKNIIKRVDKMARDFFRDQIIKGSKAVANTDVAAGQNNESDMKAEEESNE